jgi:hypothetical protein
MTLHQRFDNIITKDADTPGFAVADLDKIHWPIDIYFDIAKVRTEYLMDGSPIDTDVAAVEHDFATLGDNPS